MGKEAWDAAVRENRMVSRKEGTIRRVVGTIFFVIASWNLWSKGVANVTAGSTCFWFALAITTFMSGILNQCGCVVNLRWAVEEDTMARYEPPPQYLPFLKSKRRQFYKNVVGSALVSMAGTLCVYATVGVTGRSVVLSATKGMVVEMASMMVAAYMA